MPVTLAYETYYEGDWGLPVANLKGGWVVTSPYGPRIPPEEGASEWHPGMDIAAQGTGICGGNAIATAAGRVDCIEFDEGGYGLMVWVLTPHPKFPDGLYVLYAHGARALVSEGQWVEKGTPLTDFEDEYGNGTGLGSAHLHFEIRYSYEKGENGANTLNPAAIVYELAQYDSGESMQVGVPYRVPDSQGVFQQFKAIYFEFKYEMVKGFRDIFESISKTIVGGMRRLHGIIRNLFIILIMIDLALGTMFKMFSDDDGGSMVRFLLHKFLFYGIMLLLIEKFPDLANHFVKDFFIAGAGRAMSVEEAEVVRLISDPMLIIDKGMNIIQPFINAGLDFSWPIVSSMLSSFLPEQISSIVEGPGLFEAILILILCFFFIIMLFFVACAIALAYIQFYFMILFSFTTMIFAGTKQTRQTRLANRGLSGVFAGAINLMFYCLFSLMLVNSLVSIASQAQEAPVTKTVEVEGIKIVNAEDLRARIRAKESGIPANYQSMGGGDTDHEGTNAEYYGAFHLRVSDWDTWCEEAYNDGAPLIKSETTGSYPTNDSYYRWTPENQEALVLWKLKKDYEKMGDWKKVTEEFYNHCGPHDKNFEDYWKTIAKQPLDNKPKNVRSASINILVLVQLNICLAAFMFLGTRMSRSINSLFQGGGFELLNSQND